MGAVKHESDSARTSLVSWLDCALETTPRSLELQSEAALRLDVLHKLKVCLTELDCT